MCIADGVDEWRQGGKIYLPAVLCKRQSVHETGLQGYWGNAGETTERTEETRESRGKRKSQKYKCKQRCGNIKYKHSLLYQH